MASEIWSAILSGWPSVTDSEVNRKRFFDGKLVSPSSHVRSFIARLIESRGARALRTWDFEIGAGAA